MESALKVFSVAVGGAAGALARYLINLSPLAGAFEKFPLPTLTINLSGSFLIGLLLILLTDRIEVSENLRLGIIVGFLGAFTTFSTFEMELYGLMRDRHFGSAAIYALLSIFAGFAAVLAGIAVGRNI